MFNNFSKVSIPILSKYSVILLFIVSLFSSCIPTKKITYLSDVSEGSKFAVQDLNYLIRPGDRFYIKVVDPMANSMIGSMESSSGSATQTVNVINQAPTIHDFIVKEDGKIDYPMIGEIDAAGKTITELRTEIYEKCKGYITNPSVKIYMTNYNVTILGEVNNPGFYQLITNNPTIFDAIGLASDLTDFANRKVIKLIRKNEGELTVHYLDLTSTEFIQSPYYYIQPNDVIHVAPLKVKKFSSDNALPLVLSIITTIITVVSITSR
jgi:polysaccharide export outer membrane protein